MCAPLTFCLAGGSPSGNNVEGPASLACQQNQTRRHQTQFSAESEAAVLSPVGPCRKGLGTGGSTVRVIGTARRQQCPFCVHYAGTVTVSCALHCLGTGKKSEQARAPTAYPATAAQKDRMKPAEPGTAEAFLGLGVQLPLGTPHCIL